MSSAVDAARTLAENARTQSFDKLADSTVRATAEALYDTVAVALAGVRAPGLAEARKALLGWGSGRATVWGGFGSAPAPFAGIVNAAALHALDYDDTDDAVPLHANSVVLPVLIADMEENRPDCRGHEFLAALATGLDASMRVGRAGGPRGSRGWNYSVISGGIGAALALARLRRWDTDTAVNALGHQLAQTGGSLQSIIDGSLAKRFQPAMVVKDVLIGAALAGAGIDGPVNVLEGRAGFFSLYQDGDYSREKLLAGLASASLVDDLSLNPYPACRFTHAAIDLALHMRSEGVAPDRVDHMTLLASGQAMNMVGRDFDSRTAGVVDAQFSMAYTASVALHRGAVLIDDFTPARIRDETIGRFCAERVRIEVSPGLDFLAMAPVTARVDFRDGSTGEFTVKTVSGSPETPMSVERLKAKAADCLAHGHSRVSSDELWSAVEALTADGPASDLVDLLRRPSEED